MFNLRNLKPKFIDNSRIPAWLSNFAPINIWAISFALWVWCRGESSDKTRRHETIHFQQQIELLFVGQWVLYLVFWLVGLVRYRDGKKAYKENPFEREAFRHDDDEGYLATRHRYTWLFYTFE